MPGRFLQKIDHSTRLLVIILLCISTEHDLAESVVQELGFRLSIFCLLQYSPISGNKFPADKTSSPTSFISGASLKCGRIIVDSLMRTRMFFTIILPSLPRPALEYMLSYSNALLDLMRIAVWSLRGDDSVHEIHLSVRGGMTEGNVAS